MSAERGRLKELILGQPAKKPVEKDSGASSDLDISRQVDVVLSGNHDTDDRQGRVLLYYCYADVSNPTELRLWQVELCKMLKLRGRIHVAGEGINGTVAGHSNETDLYELAMRSHAIWGPLFRETDFKRSTRQRNQRVFSSLFVKECTEIISLGIAPSKITWKDGAKHLSPREFHDMLIDWHAKKRIECDGGVKGSDDEEGEDKGLVLLDCRNLYESAVGRFDGALRCPTRHFTEFPEFADRAIETMKLRDKKVLMYCTGGIRTDNPNALRCVRQSEIEQICKAYNRNEIVDSFEILEEEEEEETARDALENDSSGASSSPASRLSLIEESAQVDLTVADPFTITVVTTGILWATLALVQMSTKGIATRFLKKKDESNRQAIARAADETCTFLSEVYDRLRFQKHAIQSVMEMIAVDKNGRDVPLYGVRTDGEVVDVPPELDSWVEFMKELETNVLEFYKLFGEDSLCPTFKAPPELRFITGLEGSSSSSTDSANSRVEEEREDADSNDRCAPDLVVHAIHWDAYYHGTESWDTKRETICTSNPELLRSAWNERYRWSCTLEDIRDFQHGENCEGASSRADDSLSEASETSSSTERRDTEEDIDGEVSSSTTTSSSVSSHDRTNDGGASRDSSSSHRRDEAPWYGPLTNFAIRSLTMLRNAFRRDVPLPDTRMSDAGDDASSLSTTETLRLDDEICRVTGGYGQSQCEQSAHPNCIWSQAQGRCTSSSNVLVVVESEDEEDRDDGLENPDVRSLDVDESSQGSRTVTPLASSSSFASSTSSVSSSSWNNGVRPPTLPEIFSSKVLLVMLGSNAVDEDGKMPYGDINIEDTAYVGDLRRFMARTGEISFVPKTEISDVEPAVAGVLWTDMFEVGNDRPRVVESRDAPTLTSQLGRHVQHNIWVRKWFTMDPYKKTKRERPSSSPAEISVYPADMLGHRLDRFERQTSAIVQFDKESDNDDAIEAEHVGVPEALRLMLEGQDAEGQLREGVHCFQLRLGLKTTTDAKGVRVESTLASRKDAKLVGHVATLCAPSADMRNAWIRGIRDVHKRRRSKRRGSPSSTVFESEALSSNPSSSSKARMRTFAKRPWAQRAFKGTILFECHDLVESPISSTETSTKTTKVKAAPRTRFDASATSACEPLRSKSREPRQAGRLSKVSDERDVPSLRTEHYFVLTPDSLSWYKTMEDDGAPIDAIAVKDFDIEMNDEAWSSPEEIGSYWCFAFATRASGESCDRHRRRHKLCAKTPRAAHAWFQSLMWAFVRYYKRSAHVRSYVGPEEAHVARNRAPSERDGDESPGIRVLRRMTDRIHPVEIDTASGAHHPMSLGDGVVLRLATFRNLFPLTNMLASSVDFTATSSTTASSSSLSSSPFPDSPMFRDRSVSSDSRDAPPSWVALCKVGPSNIGKRTWRRYEIVVTEENIELHRPRDWGRRTQTYPRETDRNAPASFRVHFPDVVASSVELTSVLKIPEGKTKPKSGEDFIVSRRGHGAPSSSAANNADANVAPHSCVSFRLRHPAKWSIQVLCGTRNDHMPNVHNLLKNMALKWDASTGSSRPDDPTPPSMSLPKRRNPSSSESSADAATVTTALPRASEPRWAFSVVSSPLSRKGFLNILREMMQETMPKLQLSSWRYTGCPTGCRCPVFVSYYTLPGVSKSPDGHVKYVYRDCRRSSTNRPSSSAASVEEQNGIGGDDTGSSAEDSATTAVDRFALQLHAIELYVSSASNGVAISGDADVGDAEESRGAHKKNVWPLFELRFLQSTENPIGYFPGDDVTDPSLRLAHRVADRRLNFCDRGRLAEILELLWQFVRRRDGEDLWHRWSGMIPRSSESAEALLIGPLIETYRSEVERRVRRERSGFAFGSFAESVSSTLCSCSSEEIADTLFDVHLQNRLMEHFFGTESSAAFSGLTQTRMMRSNFHATMPDKVEADAILRVLWNAQNEHGCAPNQIYHPLERRCYGFCREWGPRVVRSRRCVAVAQPFAGDRTCGPDVSERTHTVSPPSKGACKKVCQRIFGNHPMCLVADPEKMPQVRNEFMRENELGITKYKYVFWDAPRIAIPAFVLSAQVFGHSVVAVSQSNWFVQFLTGTSQVVGGTSMTFVGIASSTAVIVLNVINAVISAIDTYNTVASYHEESAFLDMVLEQQLKMIDYARCRALGHISIAREATTVPDSVSGRSLIGRVVDDMKAAASRAKITSTRIGELFDKICSRGPVPHNIESFHSRTDESLMQWCRRLLRKLDPKLIFHEQLARTKGREREADRPMSRANAIDTVMHLLHGLYGENGGLRADVDDAFGGGDPSEIGTKKHTRASGDEEEGDEEALQCSEIFPYAHLDESPRDPLSAVYAGWLMREEGTSGKTSGNPKQQPLWRRYLDRLRRLDNERRYEMIFRDPVVDDSSAPPGKRRADILRAMALESRGDAKDRERRDAALADDVVKVDLKQGMTDPARLVLVGVREPSRFPVTGLRFMSLPKGSDWSPLAVESAPTKYEYDQAIVAASKGEQPVGLVPPLLSRKECDRALYAREVARRVKRRGPNDCSPMEEIDKCKRVQSPSIDRCARYCTKTRRGTLRSRTNLHYECRYNAETNKCESGGKDDAQHAKYACTSGACGSEAEAPLGMRQCESFQNTFQGAKFTDTVRAGGYVDLNYACQLNKLDEGREESLLWASPSSVFLSLSTDASSPPIVDLKISDSSFSKELRAAGYYRVRENLNRQCRNNLLPSSFGGMRKSYAWYKPEFKTRLGFRGSETLGRQIAAFATRCDDRDDGRYVPSVALKVRTDSTNRRWYDRCGLCLERHSMLFASTRDRVKKRKAGPHREDDGGGSELPPQCSVSDEDGTVRCENDRSTGRMIRAEDLGTTADGRYDVRRLMEWLGDVRYKDGECKAVGLGKLKVVTQKRRRREEEESDEGEWTDAPETNVVLDAMTSILSNYEFVGEVREYSDENLYTYRPEMRLTMTPYQVMCATWRERLAQLERWRETKALAPDMVDDDVARQQYFEDYSERLVACLDRGGEDMECGPNLYLCVRGTGDDSPGLVGGPPVGTLLDALRDHRCFHAAKVLGMGDYGLTETEKDLRLAMMGRRCGGGRRKSPSDATSGNRGNGDVIMRGWLELKPVTYGRGGLAKIRHFFSSSQSYYFELHSCFGSGACALKGYRADPRETTRATCEASVRTNRCEAASLEIGNERESCDTLCVRSGTHDYRCVWSEETSRCVSRPSDRSTRCTGTCGSRAITKDARGASERSEPAVVVDLKDVAFVGTEFKRDDGGNRRHRDGDEDVLPVNGFEIVTSRRSFFLHVVSDAPTDPECAACLVEEGRKWCYRPHSVWQKGECKRVGAESCGGRRFRKVKSPDRCPLDHSKLLRRALDWRREVSRAVDEIGVATLSRPVPDGFGVLTELQRRRDGGTEDADEASSALTSRSRLRDDVYERFGRFSKGLLVSVGAIKVKREEVDERPSTTGLSGVEVGYYSVGSLTFGSAAIEYKYLHRSQRRSVYTSCDPFCTFKGMFQDMSTEDPFAWPQSYAAYPTVLGTLTDAEHRVVYWGSFALWHPWGIGVYWDRAKRVVFRGVIKKEYEAFLDEDGIVASRRRWEAEGHSGEEDSRRGNEEEWEENLHFVPRRTSSAAAADEGRRYVPVLAGVLSRLSDGTIADAEVLALGPDDLPGAVLDLAKMYFGEDSRYKIMCRSRAVSSYEVFTSMYKGLSRVWLAVSEFTNFQFEGRVDITGSGTQVDISLGDIDTALLIQTHTSRMVALRRHIRDVMTPRQRVAMDRALARAIEVLTLSQRLGRPFDPFDRYWRDMEGYVGGAQRQRHDDGVVSVSDLRDVDIDAVVLDGTAQRSGITESSSTRGFSEKSRIMRTAARLRDAGPEVYLRYANAKSILEGIDDLLRFASEMYCSLCTEEASDHPRKADRSPSMSDDDGLPSFAQQGTTDERPRVKVRVWRGRNLGRGNKQETDVSAYAVVQIASEEMRTGVAESGIDPEWSDGSYLVFDGAEDGLDPHSEIRLTVYAKRTLRSDVLLGTWSDKLVNLISKRSRAPRWYSLTDLLASSETTPKRQEIQLSFRVSGIATLLREYQSDVPPTCGLGGAVAALIEGVQAQLPQYSALLVQHEEAQTCAVRSAMSSNFQAAVGCVAPSAERLQPRRALVAEEDDEIDASSGPNGEDADLIGALEEEEGRSAIVADADETVGPMVFPLEGELRKDVIGGIFDPRSGVSSIAMYSDKARREGAAFYEGFEYYGTLLRTLEQRPV
eukprot:g1180.t1